MIDIGISVSKQLFLLVTCELKLAVLVFIKSFGVLTLQSSETA